MCTAHFSGHLRGVFQREGVCPGGMVSAQGGVCQESVHLPPVNRMTDRCKNITFPQVRLWAVITWSISVWWDSFPCPLWTDWRTHTTENITFPQLHWRAVKTKTPGFLISRWHCSRNSMICNIKRRTSNVIMRTLNHLTCQFPVTVFAHFYRPQQSCGKVMFLHLSVILFTEGLPYPPLGRHPQGRQPPWANTSPAQCMLGDTVNKRAVRILLECNLVSVILM